MKKKLIAILLIVILILGTIATLLILLPSKNVKEQRELLALIHASQTLKRVWEEGDINKKWINGKYKCELNNKERVGDDFFRCNPSFLECYLANEEITAEVEGKKFRVKALKQGKAFVQLVLKSKDSGIIVPDYAAMVELSLSGKKTLKVLLTDVCSETYLPQRIYALGPFKKKGDWRWDNFGQHILIDKFQVSGLDVSYWKEYQGAKSSPAYNLTRKEMNEYCAFRGKELISAHIFDAAAFHPGDLGNIRPIRSMRGPYPWTKRNKDSFLYRARISSNFNFESRYCDKAFTKECLQYFRPKGYDLGSVSWMGMYQILGGSMEVQNNIAEEKKNLMPSSILFDVKSPWHQLGLRAYWDGKDYLPNAFDWKGYEPEKFESLIGFRCMRYVNEDY